MTVTIANTGSEICHLCAEINGIFSLLPAEFLAGLSSEDVHCAVFFSDRLFLELHSMESFLHITAKDRGHETLGGGGGFSVV